MVLTRKQQILFKRETSEAVNASPTGSDAVLVYEPSISDSVETTDRVPAGATLSREVVPTGRRTRTISYQSDFRGGGAGGGAPDWAEQLECSAFETAPIVAIPIAGAITGEGFQMGEIVQEGSSAIRGIVLAAEVGGSIVHRMTAAGTLFVVEIAGEFTDTASLEGESSGSTATGGTVTTRTNGYAYKPTSSKIVTLTLSGGGFSGSDPAAGDVITVERSSAYIGSVQVISGSGTSFDVTLLDGEVLGSDTLDAGGGNTATITASGVNQTKTPSATIRHNLDGRQRDLVGARGDFELTADAGGPLVFAWTWTGDPATAADAVAATTSGLSAIRAPRLFAADGAIVAFARTVNVPDDGDTAVPILRLATKSVGYSSGNSVNPDLDANSEGGNRGANVVDRDATFSATVNQAHSAFDWESYRDNAQTVHGGVIVGNATGNICGFVVPNGQVLEANVGDSDGVATHEVQIKPRRVLEGGDDEVVFFQL